MVFIRRAAADILYTSPVRDYPVQHQRQHFHGRQQGKGLCDHSELCAVCPALYVINARRFANQLKPHECVSANFAVKISALNLGERSAAI